MTSLSLDLSSNTLNEKVKDLAANENYLFVLKGETVDLYERESLTFVKTIKTHKRGQLRSRTFLGGSPSFAEGITVYKGKLFIAHGDLGLKVIDIKTGSILNSHKIKQKYNKSYISSAIDVTQNEGKIILPSTNKP